MSFSNSIFLECGKLTRMVAQTEIEQENMESKNSTHQFESNKKKLFCSDSWQLRCRESARGTIMKTGLYCNTVFVIHAEVQASLNQNELFVFESKVLSRF